MDSRDAHLPFLPLVLCLLQASEAIRWPFYFQLTERVERVVASFHFRIKSGKKGTASEHAAYITRQGKHRAREDLVCQGHGNMPKWAEHDPQKFWKTGDKYERANGAVYREHEIAIPKELTQHHQLELVQQILKLVASNKPFQFAVHAPNSSLEGATNIHLHLMFSDRLRDGIDRPPEQEFRRYCPKSPLKGGCKKASGGKNRMELRNEVLELRKGCADLINGALAKHGHAARVDHRTLRQQGTRRKPERHLGPAKIRNMSKAEKEQFVAARKATEPV